MKFSMKFIKLALITFYEDHSGDFNWVPGMAAGELKRVSRKFNENFLKTIELQRENVKSAEKIKTLLR